MDDNEGSNPLALVGPLIVGGYCYRSCRATFIEFNIGDSSVTFAQIY